MQQPDTRTVIVTGGSRGLGRSIALRFGSSSCRVGISYRTGEKEAQTIANEILARGGDSMAVRADVRDRQAIDAMINETVNRWGTVDVLVNNAGITRDGLMVRMREDEWDDVLAVDLHGPFRVLRAVAAVMMTRGGGHIINISSISAVQGREGQANYSAAKAGLIGLTKAAARELGRYDIKVNAVLPGFLPTDMGQTVDGHTIDRIVRENTLGRSSEPGEVAEFIYRLSLMKNVSGQVFNLDSRVL